MPESSKYVTVKNLAESLNIQEIEIEARKEWEKEQRGRRRLEQRLIQVVPASLVLMVIVFYGLSAPHTAELLGYITPNVFGQSFSPIGFEIGVLAFSILRELGLRNLLTAVVLGVLLILSILINVAGGVIAVITANSSEIAASDTLEALMGRFGALPATIQVVLVLAVLIGALIPILSMLVGESVVKLALGKVRLEQQSDEERWAFEAAHVMYAALLQAALKAGAGAKTAGNYAQSIADQMYAYRPPSRRGQSETVQRLSQPVLESPSALPVLPSQVQVDKEDEKDSDSPAELRVKKADVLAWLNETGTHDHLSDREVSKLYTLARFGTSSESAYKTIQRARKELKG